MDAVVLLGSFLLLMVLGLPVAYALGLAALARAVTVKPVIGLGVMPSGHLFAGAIFTVGISPLLG